MRHTPWPAALLLVLLVLPVPSVLAAGGVRPGPLQADQQVVCVMLNDPPELPGYAVGASCEADVAVSFNPATGILCVSVKGQGGCQKLPVSINDPLRDWPPLLP